MFLGALCRAIFKKFINQDIVHARQYAPLTVADTLVTITGGNRGGQGVKRREVLLRERYGNCGLDGNATHSLIVWRLLSVIVVHTSSVGGFRADVRWMILDAIDRVIRRCVKQLPPDSTFTTAVITNAATYVHPAEGGLNWRVLGQPAAIRRGC